MGQVKANVSRQVRQDIVDHNRKAGRGETIIAARGILSGAADALTDLVGRRKSAEEVYRLADQIVARGVSDYER